MTIDNIGLFQGLSAKMAYLHKRQAVLAQNVANADTPNYIPRDLQEVDFSSVLDSVNSKANRIVQLEGTSSKHMNPRNSIEMGDFRARVQSDVYEISPSGNAVIMEEQMMKAAQTTMDYNLMATIYQKNVGMLRTAIGQNR